jgi:hypothetical protein
MKHRTLMITAAVGAVLLGWYTKHRIDRAEIEKDWVRLKGFSGAVQRGSVKSMKPVNLSVWRYRSDDMPETTHEHLDFAIPAAYMIDTSNLSGGAQKAIYLYVHWPTGDPSGFHERPEPYNMLSSGWPTEEYFIEIHSDKPLIINDTRQWRIQYFKNLLSIGGKRQAAYQGKYCGWHAFDRKNTGRNIFEYQNPKAGVKSELYFDSINPVEWRRWIYCGPDMRVCHFETHYQRFRIRINFSPLNICKAEQFENQVRGMLDKFLVAHHPPTRMWGPYRDPHAPPWVVSTPYDNSNEWTRANLNNPNIRDAAK